MGFIGRGDSKVWVGKDSRGTLMSTFSQIVTLARPSVCMCARLALFFAFRDEHNSYSRERNKKTGPRFCLFLFFQRERESSLVK